VWKKHVSRPVLWHESMTKLLQEAGIDHFVEIGTGRVLAGLAKRAARDLQRQVTILNIENMEDVKKNA